MPGTAIAVNQSPHAKTLLVSFFEWFGELEMGAFAPPYEPGGSGSLHVDEGRFGERPRATEARSMVVRDYLTKNFKLDDTRIKTLGLGKAGETGDNGKVEIIVYPVGSIPPVQNYPPTIALLARDRPAELARATLTHAKRVR